MMMPQALKSWRSKRVEDLSVAAIMLYCSNCFLWFAYGAFSSPILIPVVLANIIGLVVGTFQLFIKLRYASKLKGVKLEG